MHKNDAVEQAYNNGFCKGRRYGVCEFCGYLIAQADESGVVRYERIAEHARDYLDRLQAKEGERK